MDENTKTVLLEMAEELERLAASQHNTAEACKREENLDWAGFFDGRKQGYRSSAVLLRQRAEAQTTDEIGMFICYFCGKDASKSGVSMGPLIIAHPDLGPISACRDCVQVKIPENAEGTP